MPVGVNIFKKYTPSGQFLISIVVCADATLCVKTV
jgi:hypothetical protein